MAQTLLVLMDDQTIFAGHYQPLRDWICASTLWG